MKEMTYDDRSVALKLSEIEDDVDFVSWKVAKCRVSEGGEAKAERMTGEDSSRDWMLREVGDALSELRGAVSFVVVEEPVAEADNVLREPCSGEWKMMLRMEPEWRGSVKRVERLMHRYVVRHVLVEWFALVLPDEVVRYERECEDCLAELVVEVRKVQMRDVKFFL